MRGTGKLLTTTALLMGALLSVVAAVAPDVASSKLDSVKVAMAQPLTAMDSAALVALPRQSESNPTLPESAMLIVVGSALLGLAALVRKNT